MRTQLPIIACFIAIAGCSSVGTVPPEAAASETAAASPSAKMVSVERQIQDDLRIEVQQAGLHPLSASITTTGQLQINEDNTWIVGAVTEGRIVSVPVHLGDTVKAGQIVAEMHSHEVHDSRALYQQAMLNRDRLKVLSLQARRVRDRTQRLFDLKAASREQLEAARTEYESSELSIANAEAEVRKNEVHLTEFLDVSLSEEGHGSGDSEHADFVPIRAPAFGTVMERFANAGTVVSVAMPVLTISDLSSLWVIAAVNEADLSHVRRGQEVSIAVRAYPETTFPGRVFQLGERLDPQTRTLQLRILAPNAQGLLKPDMFATVAFSASPGKDRIHLPESAIQELNGRSVVFVQKDDQTFAPREVTTGTRVAGQIEILEGLQLGTSVVVNGALLLKSQLLQAETN